jgi:hypothetical protein
MSNDERGGMEGDQFVVPTVESAAAESDAPPDIPRMSIEHSKTLKHQREVGQALGNAPLVPTPNQAPLKKGRVDAPEAPTLDLPVAPLTEFHVNIKNGEDKFRVKVQGKDSVMALKTAIMLQHNYANDLQQLYFADALLEVDRCLRDCNIQHDSELELVMQDPDSDEFVDSRRSSNKDADGSPGSPSNKDADGSPGSLSKKDAHGSPGSSSSKDADGSPGSLPIKDADNSPGRSSGKDAADSPGSSSSNGADGSSGNTDDVENPDKAREFNLTLTSH